MSQSDLIVTFYQYHMISYCNLLQTCKASVTTQQVTDIMYRSGALKLAPIFKIQIVTL